jgi:hypothetical protein
LFPPTFSQLNISHSRGPVLEKREFRAKSAAALGKIFLSYAFQALCARHPKSAWAKAIAAAVIFVAFPAFAGVTGQAGPYTYNIQGSSAVG